MLQQEILIGGEESGGVWTIRHMPERDGIFLNLFMLDLLAFSGKKPTELIRDMWKEFGEFHFGRRDLHVPIAAVLPSSILCRRRLRRNLRAGPFRMSAISMEPRYF